MPEALTVIAYHEHHLGMGLQPNHAVHDMHTRSFEPASPLNIRGLIEPRLQLHQHGNLHPALRGADQAPKDRAVGSRAIQRHLDRLHMRVVSRLGDEGLNAARETLIRMVDQQRTIIHHIEETPVGFLRRENATGGGRHPGPILQVGTIEPVQLEQARQVEERRMLGDVALVDTELTHQQAEHLGADTAMHLKADRPVEPLLSELELNRLEQVVRLVLLKGEIGVSRHSERGPLLHDHADEEGVEVGGDHLLGGHEPAVTERDEPGEHLRDLESHEPAFRGGRISHRHRDREREVRDVGEGVTGIDRERCEHGEDAILVERAGRQTVTEVEVAPPHDRQARLSQRWKQIVDEQRLLAAHEHGDPRTDFGELLRRRQAVGRLILDSGRNLILEGGDAHLEELIEV